MEYRKFHKRNGKSISMTTVLILNHYQKSCGVQQFGRRIYDLAKASKTINYEYREVEDTATFLKYYNGIKPDIILYNWHRGTMPWLTEDIIKSLKNVKHYFIFHEEVTRINYDKYLFFGDYDFTGGKKFGKKKILLPRPLLEYTGDYPKNDIITIGSFGFGFWQKGYHTLTKLVSDTFDKAILNLHMPYSYFGDPLKKQTNEVQNECWKMATNPNLRLNITHDFLDDNGVLKFLAGNDINVFLYGENGQGISSVIDYALSVRRPIAISESKMFRHIATDEIIVGKKSIQEILSNGTKPLEQFYKKWSVEKFSTEMDKTFDGNF
jgi:hypothetical protein